MDFRTCPACKASVLDDDAQDCPFCGASMTTGKPSASAQPSGKSAAPSPAPQKPAEKRGTSPAAKASAKQPAKPAARAASSSGDPFDVDTSAARKAIPVRPRPSKGRMVRVVCPMCETPGFIAPQDAGKEVKCCNPECLVPVYTAEKPPEKEPEPEPVADSGAKAWIYTGLAVLAVVGLGYAAYVSTRKPPEATGPIAVPSPTEDLEEEEDDGTKPPVAAAPVAMSREEVRTRAFDGLRQASQDTDNPRDRSYAARMLAEALMETGEPEKAQVELSDLPRASKYAAVIPLTIGAWRQLESKNPEAAGKLLDEAAAAAATLPREGRELLDSTAALAAALAAAGREDAAVQLVSKEFDRDLGQSSALWRAALDGGDFEYGELSRRTCLRHIPQPVWGAVTQSLAARGRWEQARSWAAKAPDAATRDACAAIVAAELAAQNPAGEVFDQLLAPLLESLSPAGTARVWSAIGQVRLQANDAASATDAAGKASAALSSASPAEAQAIAPPGMKELYELADQPQRGLPAPQEAISASMAAGDASALLARQKQFEPAWAATLQGLKLLEGMGPRVDATAPLLDDVQQRTRPTREQLVAALQLDQTQAFSAFSKYQSQVQAWHQRALERMEQEVRLLATAAEEGMLEQVWGLLKSEGEAGGAQQALRTTRLPAWLRGLAEQQGKADLVKEIDATLPPEQRALTPADKAILAVRTAKPGSWDSLLRELDQYYQGKNPERYRVDIELLKLVANTAEAQPEEALSFATQLTDTLILEDALWLVAARGTRAGAGGKLLKAFSPRAYPAASRLALYRGFIDGSVE